MKMKLEAAVHSSLSPSRRGRNSEVCIWKYLDHENPWQHPSGGGERILSEVEKVERERGQGKKRKRRTEKRKMSGKRRKMGRRCSSQWILLRLYCTAAMNTLISSRISSVATHKWPIHLTLLYFHLELACFHRAYVFHFLQQGAHLLLVLLLLLLPCSYLHHGQWTWTVAFPTTRLSRGGREKHPADMKTAGADAEELWFPSSSSTRDQS